MVSKESLISYSLSFCSFLLDTPFGKNINKIILFGSVARGDYNEDSDIDIFIDTEKNLEKLVDKYLNLFQESKQHEIWIQKGITNEISIKVGKLKEWKLRREVISSGILLYGKYSELPDELSYYLLIKIKDIYKKKPSNQVKIWRKLYGYKQKVGKKTYLIKGLIDKNNGKKIAKSVFIIPMENRKPIIEYLNKNKIIYTVHELWSDSL